MKNCIEDPQGYEVLIHNSHYSTVKDCCNSIALTPEFFGHRYEYVSCHVCYIYVIRKQKRIPTFLVSALDTKNELGS